MNAGAVIGLAVMILSEAATLAGREPIATWNTPICWTGFILFADSVVWRARGNSWIRSSPREFIFLALVSIPLWLVFEFYNLFIENWHYGGLPENPVLRYAGYSWSFATIWPAIFEGADLIAVWRTGHLFSTGAGALRLRSPILPRASADAPKPRRRRAPPARSYDDASPRISFSSARHATPARLPRWGPRHGRRRSLSALPALPGLPALSVAAGAMMLAWPLLRPSPYLAAPVWLGFIFLLDPINARLGAESLYADILRRRFDRIRNLMLSGLVCGILWECWNYWARAKWRYTVPIMENLKIFEMPVPGYLGFPVFALECFTMYVFVRKVFAPQLGRTIAL